MAAAAQRAPLALFLELDPAHQRLVESTLDAHEAVLGGARALFHLAEQLEERRQLLPHHSAVCRLRLAPADVHSHRRATEHPQRA